MKGHMEDKKSRVLPMCVGMLSIVDLQWLSLTLSLTLSLSLSPSCSSSLPKVCDWNWSNSNPTYWLINPSKSEIGKISKHILDYINTQLMDKLQINQWKNTKAVINWFTAITNKNNTAFIQFDITDFYPSITEYTFDRV